MVNLKSWNTFAGLDSEQQWPGGHSTSRLGYQFLLLRTTDPNSTLS